MTHKAKKILVLVLAVVMLTSLACNLSNIGGTRAPATPTAKAGEGKSATLAVATPTSRPPVPTPAVPLPPALVESDPPVGAEVGLKKPVTFYFNQPMDRASVEKALLSQPDVAGKLDWSDDATMTFIPSQPLAPNSSLTLKVGEGARSARGLALTQAISVTFPTAGYLRLSQALPKPGATDVDPTSAVVAAFSRPVVPLGAEQASLPAGFSLRAPEDPQPKGKGEWLNTSTYIFYPEPSLAGGSTYTVTVTPDLLSADGSPLEAPASWSFTTTLPKVVAMQPSIASQNISLDSTAVITFNQPMDPASVEASFQLKGPQAPVAGATEWDKDQTVMRFKPAALLARDTTYTIQLGAEAKSLGGKALGEPLQSTFVTVPDLFVTLSEPGEGQLGEVYSGVMLHFSAPIQDKDFLKHVTLTPSVANMSSYYDPNYRTVNIGYDVTPQTNFTLTVDTGVTDIWGGKMAQPFTLHYRTKPLQPSFAVQVGSDVIFLTPQDAFLEAQATNVSRVPVEMGSVPLDKFIEMMGPNGYEIRQNYKPADMRSWEQNLEAPGDKSQVADIYLNPERQPLAPGIYLLRFNFKQAELYPFNYLLVVSNIQTTVKMSATDALVWAVDLRGNTPLAQAPVTIYDGNGNVLAEGQTDAQGIYTAGISRKDPYDNSFALVGNPGEATFSIGMQAWSQGVASYDFGIPTNYNTPPYKLYLYSDRPLYRPGDTVYYRAVLRKALNGRYQLPDVTSIPLVISNNMGQEIERVDLPLDAFGSAHGEYQLAQEVQPGYYSIRSDLAPEGTLGFNVAEYRKPGIDLAVAFGQQQAKAGDTLNATINARYFFDAPVGNADLHWALYALPSTFDLPGYQVGKLDLGWSSIINFSPFMSPPGMLISEGDAKTQPDGSLALQVTATSDKVDMTLRQRFTLEATAKDESGQPVSGRATIEVNPSDVYIGVRPDTWAGRVGTPFGFDVQLVNWDKSPAGARPLVASFQKVTWVQKELSTFRPVGPSLEPQYTDVGSTNFQTNDQGQARLSFDAPDPGTYQLSVTGDGARTEILMWVGGEGQAVWPNLPNQRLKLVADKESYQAGESAQVFVPNPFSGSVQALLTVERSVVMRHEVITIQGGGETIAVPLGEEDAPNVFVAVTLLGQESTGIPGFRQGYVELKVDPKALLLQVSLKAQPDNPGPGEQATFDIQVSDAQGNPVQGQFSLAVVDKALLALADPNSPEISQAFYGEQQLSVRTGISLAAYARRSVFFPGGIGGGGGEGLLTSMLRSYFPDTAFWQADITTGADGKAQVNARLPDNLTTWVADLRGITADSKVGFATTEIVVSKQLLVRPVTPRFLVAGDHVLLSAVVNNLTGSDLATQVTLQASGVALDDNSQAVQQVQVPAGGRARVEWWATVQDAAEAELIFSAQAPGLEDITRPDQGVLPILRYSARQSFRTSGVIDEGGEAGVRTELVSLPRSFQAGQGELEVELAPSLAATVASALNALDKDTYNSTEQVVSRFVPALQTLDTLKKFGVETQSLQAQVDSSLKEGLAIVMSRQNWDGGWGWWPGESSDAYLTSYVLFGFSQAQKAGASVDPNVVQRAADYLHAGLPAPEMLNQDWELNRLVFEHFALNEAGFGNGEAQQALYELRARLDPWAQALLALSMGGEPGDTLVSDLESSALRSASGAHWEARFTGGANMISTVNNTAMVIYLLAQRDPGSPLLADSVRYLMAARYLNGSWESSYTTAWSVLAVDAYMNGTGELGGDFTFSAAVNGAPLASGQAGEAGQLTTVHASLPTSSLNPEYPNTLTIQRDPGAGRLYYTAGLNVSRPVDSIAPLEQGMSVSRSYLPFAAGADASPIQSAAAGQRVTAKITLTLPQDGYYVVLEDYIPAGAEILDTTLKTSQLGGEVGPNGEVIMADPHAQPEIDVRDPFAGGWGWWLFLQPQVHDDRITWTATHLPAGTYVLTYTLVTLQPGEYQVLPAHAWEYYFPEVQGNSAGGSFAITK